MKFNDGVFSGLEDEDPLDFSQEDNHAEVIGAMKEVSEAGISLIAKTYAGALLSVMPPDSAVFVDPESVLAPKHLEEKEEMTNLIKDGMVVVSDEQSDRRCILRLLPLQVFIDHFLKTDDEEAKEEIRHILVDERRMIIFNAQEDEFFDFDDDEEFEDDY